MRKNKKIILIGGGAHVLSLISLIKACNYTIEGYSDFSAKNHDLKYLGKDDDIINNNSIRKNFEILVGVGVNVKKRDLLFEKFKKKKFKIAKLIHPDVVVEKKFTLNDGVTIFSGVKIGYNVQIFSNAVIHLSSIIEHNSVIGQSSYVAPGSIVLGDCKIGKRVFLGANSTVIQNLIVKNDIVLGAGSVLTKSFKKNNLVLKGVPARI